MSDSSNQGLPPQTLQLELTPQGNTLNAKLIGELRAHTLVDAWNRIIAAIDSQKPQKVVIEGSQLRYCDGAGLGLFVEIKRLLRPWSGTLEFAGLPPQLQTLIESSANTDVDAVHLKPRRRVGFAREVGKETKDRWDEISHAIAFLGEILAGLAWAIAHPFKLRRNDLVLACEKVGVNALPVLSLLGFIIGVIIAFQSAIPMQRYGASDVIPTIVALSVVRELGPLITAILLAGRSGSAFAAEIGTMKITEELSALESLGLNPIHFLVVPRVIAAMCMTPMLTAYAMLTGLMGGYTIMLNYGYNLTRYVNAVQDSLTWKDVVGSLIKSVVFAMLVSGVGCMFGMRTKSGPGAVGDSTTRAVVAGIVLIVIADGIFGVIFYYLNF